MFKINVSRVEDHTFILNLEGELTADASIAFHKALVPILDKHPKAVSINLSRIDSIDEAGFAMLMGGLQGTPGQGIYFYLIGLPATVKEYYRARSEDLAYPYFSITTH